MSHFEEPREDTLLVEMMAGLPKHYRARKDYDRLYEKLAEARKIVRWNSGETMTCWHRDGDFRVTYKGGTYDCPACNHSGSFAAEIEGPSRAAVEAERERCAGVADRNSVRYGSLAEGQNDPEFGQLIFAEEVCRSFAAAIRRGPDD